MADWTENQQDELLDAVRAFKAKLPGWWYTVGECSVSCDASCGPDVTGPDRPLLKIRRFDDGFHVDLPQPSTLAAALRRVTEMALSARAELDPAVKHAAGVLVRVDSPRRASKRR